MQRYLTKSTTDHAQVSAKVQASPSVSTWWKKSKQKAEDRRQKAEEDSSNENTKHQQQIETLQHGLLWVHKTLYKR